MNLPQSPSDVPANRRRLIVALAAIAVLAIAVRGVAVWFLADGLRQDTDGYRAVAQSLLDHGDFLRDGRRLLFLARINHFTGQDGGPFLDLNADVVALQL